MQSSYRLLSRFWMVPGLVGFLIAFGGSPAVQAEPGTEERLSDVADPLVQELRHELQDLRLKLERLRTEYEKTKDEYQKAMQQTEKQLQALDARLKAAASPSVAAQPLQDVHPAPSGQDWVTGAPSSNEPRPPRQVLRDEDLDRIIGAGAPSSPAQIAQAGAPVQPETGKTSSPPTQTPPSAAPEAPQPEAGKPSAPEAGTPSSAAPTPAAKPAAGEAEEEREGFRVPLASIERGGTLLQRGAFILETSFGYTHSRTSHLILTGFSVLPLIILGTLETEKVTSDSFGPTFSIRAGVYKDLQFDASIPLSYQTQSTVRLSNDVVALTEDNATQFGLGDISAGLTYQLLYERGLLPDLSVNLRARAPTGRSQFDIYKTIADQGGFQSVENFVERLHAEGLPIGSGFWGLSGGLSAVKAFDPAVVFGSVGYNYSFPADVTLISLTGSPAEGGVVLQPTAIKTRIEPGGTLNFGLGFAIALTKEVSVSFGFTEGISFTSKQNGVRVADSYLNVGQFNVGFTVALSRRVSVSFSGTIGVTPDAPSLTLGLSVPIAFESIKDLWPF